MRAENEGGPKEPAGRFDQFSSLGEPVRRTVAVAAPTARPKVPGWTSRLPVAAVAEELARIQAEGYGFALGRTERDALETFERADGRAGRGRRLEIELDHVFAREFAGVFHFDGYGNGITRIGLGGRRADCGTRT